jgi:hypothetical protein
MKNINPSRSWHRLAACARPKRLLQRVPIAAIGAAGIWLGGCAAQAPPAIVHEPQVVRLPETGELEVHARALAPAGDVLPVLVSIKNVTPRARVLGHPAIRGITDSGEEVAELDLHDPAVTENAGQLLLEVKDASKNLMAETFGGKNLGWTIAAGPMLWTIVGVSYAVTAVSGSTAKLAGYTLEVKNDAGAGNLSGNPNGYVSSVSGCVFLANRTYSGIEVNVKNVLTGNSEVLTVPWSSAADLAAQRPVATN